MENAVAAAVEMTRIERMRRRRDRRLHPAAGVAAHEIKLALVRRITRDGQGEVGVVVLVEINRRADGCDAFLRVPDEAIAVGNAFVHGSLQFLAVDVEDAPGWQIDLQIVEIVPPAVIVQDSPVTGVGVLFFHLPDESHVKRPAVAADAARVVRTRVRGHESVLRMRVHVGQRRRRTAPTFAAALADAVFPRPEMPPVAEVDQRFPVVYPVRLGVGKVLEDARAERPFGKAAGLLGDEVHAGRAVAAEERMQAAAAVNPYDRSKVMVAAVFIRIRLVQAARQEHVGVGKLL